VSQIVVIQDKNVAQLLNLVRNQEGVLIATLRNKMTHDNFELARPNLTILEKTIEKHLGENITFLRKENGSYFVNVNYSIVQEADKLWVVKW